MTKKFVWVIVSCLMALSLIIASCGPSAVEEEEEEEEVIIGEEEEEEEEEEVVTPADNTPKYGGTYCLGIATEPTRWHPSWTITGDVHCLQYQHLWEGNWAKGPAGGYGTNETNWAEANNDLWDLKEGRIVESWKWSVDDANDKGTIVYQIRRGVHFFLNDWSEATKVVGGREVTADDVVYSLEQHLQKDGDAFVFRVSPDIRVAEITKTGPWEVTVKVPVAALVTAVTRCGDAVVVYPREAAEKYGNLNDPENAVGTGSFMIKDYVPGSQVTLTRNPNFWMKDPVGPGKGNQLPYIENVKVFIIPDASTRQAAFRTGKIDFMPRWNAEDAAIIRKQHPELKESKSLSYQGRTNPTYMRLDTEPFDDIRVRQALMLATDFKGILQDLHGGEGQIVHLWADTKEYHDLVVHLDDPDFPPETKELYNYNPEKAKQLLAEAGFPDGFKTYVNVSTTGVTYVGTSEADYYSIFNAMWNKIGVELELKVYEASTLTNINRNLEHSPVATHQPGPVSIFHVGNPVQAGNEHNQSMVTDPEVTEALLEVRRAAITDLHEAMKIFREKIYKYWVKNVYSLPSVQGYEYGFWWPWLRNFSGEWCIGYDDQTVATFIWIDQDLKKEMGY